MNWSVFAEVIVWAITVVAGIAAYIMLIAFFTEDMTDRGTRYCVLTFIVSASIAVIGGATLAGMYAA